MPLSRRRKRRRRYLLTLKIYCCDDTPSAPRHINFFETISLLGRWSTSGSDRGIAHFFIATRNTTKGEVRKRTNEQNTWVNSRCKRGVMLHCIPLCICRLTQAWISSEISTKLLGMPTYLDRSSLTALDPLSCQLVSLLSGVDWPLASPFANCILWVSLSNSCRVPLPTSGYVEIAGSGLCLVSRQNRQKDHLLGGSPTLGYIVIRTKKGYQVFLIQIILKHMNLIHTCRLNGYYYFRSVWTMD